MRVYKSNTLCECNNCVLKKTRNSQLFDTRNRNRSYSIAFMDVTGWIIVEGTVTCAESAKFDVVLTATSDQFTEAALR